MVVDESNDGGKGGGGGGGAVDEVSRAFNNDAIVFALSGNVRESASNEVKVFCPLYPRFGVLEEVRVDGGRLVGGLGPSVGEPTGGEINGLFGVDVDGAANGGDPGAGGGKDGEEAG